MDLSWIPKLGGVMVAVTGILLPAVLLWLVLAHRARRHQRLMDTVRHYADRGLPLPRELLAPPPGPRWVSPRFIAMSLLGAGVGVAIMFWAMDLVFLCGIGALLGCVGLAQLIALKLDEAQAAAPSAAQGGPGAEPGVWR
jgi:hypothetical protein